MSVTLGPGITVSSNVIIANADLFVRFDNPPIDPIESIVQRAASEFSRRYGAAPFVENERDYFRAVTLVRRGEPVRRVIALYAPKPQLEESTREDSDDIQYHEAQGEVSVSRYNVDFNGKGSGRSPLGYLPKSSKDLKDRVLVNARLREPHHKSRSHKDPKRDISDGREMRYGKFTTIVDKARARDFLLMPIGKRSKYDNADLKGMMNEGSNVFEFEKYYGTDDYGQIAPEFVSLRPSTYKGISRDHSVGTGVSNAQHRALSNLLKELRTPQKNGRHGALLELYEDLARYDTNLFPVRTMHNQFMNAMYTAVTQNLRVEVMFALPRHVGHKVEIGYEIVPYAEPEFGLARSEQDVQTTSRPEFVKRPMQPVVTYINGSLESDGAKMYETRRPHPQLERAVGAWRT